MPVSGHNQVDLIDALETMHAPVMAHVFMGLARDAQLRDLSFIEMTAIMQVFLEGPQTISGIASRANITHFAASRLVDRLFKLGVVSRTENPDDRRSKNVDLTSKGLSLPLLFPRMTREAFQQILAPVPQASISRLGEALKEVQTYIPKIPVPFAEYGQSRPKNKST